MPPAAFLHPQTAPKSLAAGALPQTPLWELTALPRLPGLKGLFLREGEKEGNRRIEERRGDGRGREGHRTLTMLETD